MFFYGIIIEESLVDTAVLKAVRILHTDIEPVTPNHQTPWVKQWTMHEVEIPAEQAAGIAERIRLALDPAHQWYADFKSDSEHYVIFRDKVFHISNRADKAQYDAAARHGISLGIPEYQVDFAPHVVEWKR